MLAAKNPFQIILTSLSSRYWHLWVVFFHSVWDIPGSWCDQWFSLIPGHVKYYVLRLWILSKHSDLAGFLWHSFSMRRRGVLCHITAQCGKKFMYLTLPLLTLKLARVPHYCWSGMGVLASSDVSLTGRVKNASVLLPSWSPQGRSIFSWAVLIGLTPLGLFWYQPVIERERGTLLLQVNVQVLHVVLVNTMGKEVSLSPGLPTGFLWHDCGG